VTIRPSLAVIPARTGSKGLPGKNVLPLAGVPLIGHSILFAETCPEIDRCVVSTDGAEIARVARSLGGAVPFERPAELAQDDTPMMPVLRHALEQMERIDGRTYASVLLLDPTSPCRSRTDVERAFALLEAHPEAMGAVACSEPTFNPHWVGVVERDRILERAFTTGAGTTRRQDAPRFLRINGSLYLWRAEYVRSAPASWFDGAPHVCVETDERRAFSIDTRFELDCLEALASAGVVDMPWLRRGDES
jgi:N-acylneuraminate cytidylyltransferase